MDKKAAISLSVNVLVVVIISIVILSSGIVLLNNMIEKAIVFKGELDKQTDAELENLLVDQGKQVALPSNVAYLHPGQDNIFGIGMLNIGGVGESFRIQIELSRFVDEENNPLFVPQANEWPLYNREVISLKEGEHHKEGIMIEIPKNAKKGRYIFNAKVFAGETQYGNTQKIDIYVS